ncbi:chaperonin 10-like protein [Phialemonium atrogriseum]|uniref:L-arabinitol 4-dehydrogenase n=1 Tax=Phialemonium atrogriseum TaxID=1093897 RepID=A0AAJ0BX97_9PEZI|nr:chaperonin 10-like protein [Phialemonium atrogriseum]KAK1764767.1 chaperonin 10-like protein [Phialemonium atrogriseum]
MEGKSNLSFILNKPHDVSYAERPLPKLQSEHDVLVAVNYTGICGSDVHYWEHGAIGHFVVKDPMVLGHESAGTVIEVGSAVTTLRPGDTVALEPGYPCRRCANCLGGFYNLCPKMAFAATPPYDGTLTGFWVAPDDFCYKLPDNVTLQEGALIEPLAVAVHIVKQARITPGQSVVVMGAGPVGLLCAAVARSFGATKVVSVDIVPAKLAFARSFAATHTYLSQRVAPEENARNLLAVAGLPDGADAVIDASGAEPSIQASLHAVRVGGTYVQGGMGRPDITFPIMALCLKEVTARGSFRYGSGDYRLAVELVASGKVDVKKLISSVVGFGQAEEAFKKVKEGQVIKVLIAGPNEKVEGEALDAAVDGAKVEEQAEQAASAGTADAGAAAGVASAAAGAAGAAGAGAGAAGAAAGAADAGAADAAAEPAAAEPVTTDVPVVGAGVPDAGAADAVVADAGATNTGATNTGAAGVTAIGGATAVSTGACC